MNLNRPWYHQITLGYDDNDYNFTDHTSWVATQESARHIFYFIYIIPYIKYIYSTLLYYFSVNWMINTEIQITMQKSSVGHLTLSYVDRHIARLASMGDMI